MENEYKISNITITSNFISSIVVNNYEVIQSGVILLPKKYSPIKFNIFDSTLEILFDKNEEKKALSIEFDEISERYLKIVCSNWLLAGTASLKEPFFILHIGKTKVFLHFDIFSIENVSKFTYTFYRLIEA